MAVAIRLQPDLPLESGKRRKFAANGLHQSGWLAYDCCSKAQQRGWTRLMLNMDIAATPCAGHVAEGAE
jgi:hypothetical protein